MMRVCRFCTAEFLVDRECVKHEIAFHQFEPNFSLKCDFKNCPATFKLVTSYRSHRSRHKTVPKDDIPDQNIDQANNDDLRLRGGEFEADWERMDTGIDNVQETVDLPLKEVSGKFLLYVRANSNMPLTVLSNTMQHTETLVAASVAKYAKDLKENLVQQGMIPETFELPSPSLSRVFEGLQSTFLQDRYFEESLNVIQPEIIELDSSQQAVLRGSSMSGNREVKLKRPHLMYIPIIKTLKRLLKDPTVMRLMSEVQPNDRSLYTSFVDGELFKNSQFFKNHPTALRLIFYYDDLELCELLGSRSHAVGVLYMSLDNIPAKYRSRLQFIHLVAIAEKKYIQASGIDSFLEAAVLDVKKLERGIVLENKTVYGTVIGFTGDNLASHAVGGFKEGFTAAHPCRTCIAPLLDVRTCIEISKLELRSDQSYQEQIRLLNEAPSNQIRNELSIEFGLTRESILNKLEHFSVVKNFPPDAMHDIFLGCFPMTIKILLSKVIAGEVLTLDNINGYIREFDYGYSEIKSKPAEIKSQHIELNGNLRQSATEMWQLAVILPLIIGPHMDVDCDYWNVFLNLLQASMIIMAREISVDMLDYLQVKLTEYADGFLRCYRDSMIPKQHYLLHYIHYIQQYGPISQFWNMRMEARHQFFKGLAKKMKNFKNVTLSLANRNQLWEASQRFSQQFQHVDVTFCGNGTQMATVSCDYKNVLQDNWDFVVEVPFVEANNVLLVAKECCVARNFDHEKSLPIFAYLHAIIMIDNIPNLVCKEMVTRFFDSHLNAYEVEVSDTFILLEMKDLYSEAIFHWHTVHSQKYIIVKRALGPLF